MAKVWKYTGLLLIVVLALGAALVTTGESVQADNVTSPAYQPDVELQVGANGCNNINDGGVMETTREYILLDVDCWHYRDTDSCRVCDDDYAGCGWPC